MNKEMFSSNTSDWETPPELFAALDKVFKFTLDPCATKENALCNKFYTKKENGLLQNWEGERVFLNPPYGRELDKWVAKAHNEWLAGIELVVILLAARTDTKRWHKCIFPRATAICFMKKRVKFLLKGKEQGSPTFPSALVVFGDKKLNAKQQEVFRDLGHLWEL